MNKFIAGSIAVLVCLAMTGHVLAAQQIEKPAKCQNCGMDRAAFASSRVLITFDDGTTGGTDSINCAREQAGKLAPKKVKSIQVADCRTSKLIDGKKAVWVIGGSKPAVMSRIAKWAFADRKDADEFIKKFGGKISPFNGAWEAAAR